MKPTFCKLLSLVLTLLFLAVLSLNTVDVWAYPPPDPSSAASVRNSTRTTSGSFTYHGGNMLTATDTVYTIFWVPAGYSVSTRYQSLINSFLGNVAADNGKSSNVYYSLTQYTNSANVHAAYSVAFGNTAVITDPFPANGCTSSYASVCITDTQIQDELAQVMTNKGWSTANTNLYFVFTPQNVASCYDGTSSYCSFTDYCAYHNPSHTGALYATVAYPSIDTSKCGSLQTPNGDAAGDSAINIISHEHNEIITDPLHTAWYDTTRSERGDRCDWNFGTSLGWTVYGGKYNQVINGQKYWLQSEWSNQSNGCVLTGL